MILGAFMPSKPVADRTLDAKGLNCPEPVMLLHVAIDEIATGAILHVLATDPTTCRDIPQFCAFLGHTLLEQQIEHSPYEYWIKKQSN
jgi:tRNA 2-thiouridine synthesizing protein A